MKKLITLMVIMTLINALAAHNNHIPSHTDLMAKKISLKEAGETMLQSGGQGKKNGKELAKAMKLYYQRDYSKAFPLFMKLAEQGNATAQNYVGIMYETGNGVEQNYNEAVKWYRKSAEQGDTDGQCNLGVMYENGRGVSQDYNEAVKWYRESAEQGNAQGQYCLGDMYEYGKGVDVNMAQAKEWYRKAARQDYESAKEALTRLGETW